MRELSYQPVGKRVTEATPERPIAIRRSDILVVSIAGLFVVAAIAALYVGKNLFLPLVSAFVVGTMLTRVASFLGRYHVPRSLSAVLIVIVTFGAFALVVGLISAPVIDWMSRLPELAAILRTKLGFLQRLQAVLSDVQLHLGDGSAASFQLPKMELVQPTLEYLTPTFAELLLFFATLVLFIACWADLRRALVLTFPERETRLRTLRILNEIEHDLGRYLVTVTFINIGVGIATGIICAAAGMPNPAGLGALAATLNYIPIIGPIGMFVVLLAVGLVSFDTVIGGLLAPLLFAAMTFVEGHFLTPVIIGRRLALNTLAVFLALAFWTWLWGPIGAFLSAPLLIVFLVLKEHLMPAVDESHFPKD